MTVRNDGYLVQYISILIYTASVMFAVQQLLSISVKV